MTRKEKSLWTENDSGSIIHIYKADNEYDEARYVAEQIEQLHKEGKSLNNFAVLYRANAQSRTVEDQLVKRGIPYRLFGGVRFYERKEIRDILSYLKVLATLRTPLLCEESSMCLNVVSGILLWKKW